MARITVQIFREILESAQSDIDTLEAAKATSEGEDIPTSTETSAIERVQKVLRGASALIKGEIEALE